MTKIKTKPRRFAVSLLDAFDNLKVQRVKNGMDIRTMSDARISDGLAHDTRFKSNSSVFILSKLTLISFRVKSTSFD